MKLSRKAMIELFALVISLNIILRFTFVPHEVGWDNFAIHAMATSISAFGYANWWIHPASVLGSYPYSTSPSATPFLLSGISQCTGVNIDLVILLFDIFLGLFCIFAVYIMAGAIWDNDIFKFIAAFVFSTSQGIVTYTTWTAPARTLFVIFVPFFVYLLLRTRTFKVRFSMVTFIILALLLVTHHYVYFAIPIIISYLILTIFYKFGDYIKSVRMPEKIANIGILASFFIMFSINFFTRTIMEKDPHGVGSRYEFISSYMVENYTRYIGILIIFIIGGYIYLTLKKRKKFEEWFLVLTLAILAPLLYMPTYMKWYLPAFACLFIGIALVNIDIAETRRRKAKKGKKGMHVLLITLLLLSIIFTGYYQYLHFLNVPDPHKRYMEERTYVGGLWIKDNVDKPVVAIAEDHITLRVFSTSEVPTLTGVGAADLAYGFVDPKKLEVKQVHSPFSLKFYFYEPYKTVNHTLTSTFVGKFSGSDINAVPKNWVIRSMPRFNLSYYVENKDISNPFTRSVQQTKEKVYDNGKIRVWCLD
ncbi:MAG: hypothetical protein KAT65_21775 [Methanophagales archaeon]|nr:hypothetical protein [Methanophagales archaeon]